MSRHPGSRATQTTCHARSPAGPWPAAVHLGFYEGDDGKYRRPHAGDRHGGLNPGVNGLRGHLVHVFADETGGDEAPFWSLNVGTQASQDCYSVAVDAAGQEWVSDGVAGTISTYALGASGSSAPLAKLPATGVIAIAVIPASGL